MRYARLMGTRTAARLADWWRRPLLADRSPAALTRRSGGVCLALGALTALIAFNEADRAGADGPHDDLTAAVIAVAAVVWFAAGAVLRAVARIAEGRQPQQPAAGGRWGRDPIADGP